MRTTLLKLTVSLAVALAAAPVGADPIGRILSLAGRVSNGSGSYVAQRPVRVITNVPGGEELLEMDYLSLRGVARTSSSNFDRWLNSIPAGEFWRNHFESDTIPRILASDVNGPPTGDERAAIVRILGVFDEAVKNRDLDDITGQSSARTLHAALRELDTPPDKRLVRQLSVSARRLNRSLGSFSTGVTWQRFLALPDGIIAAADRPAGDVEPRSELDLEQLGEVLERYNQASESEEYRDIASLPEFKATHQRLAELVDPADGAPAQERAAAVEVLPSPQVELR